MKKALPLKQWLELEDDVNRHKAEIAQQFAEARARLLPEPEPCKPPAYVRHDTYFNPFWSSWRDPYTGAVVTHGGGDEYAARQGLFGLGLLGL